MKTNKKTTGHVRTKNQHYLPQFFTRNFATKRKDEYFVWCFSKADGRVFRPNVKNIGSETGFYDFVDGRGNTVTAESILQGADGVFSELLAIVCRDASTETLDAVRAGMAVFLGAQLARTASTREDQREAARAMNQKLREMGIDKELVPETENDLKRAHTGFVINKTVDLAAIINDMKWVLIRNATGVDFWVSDDPFFFYNPYAQELPQPFIGNYSRGLKSPGIEVFLPLSPHLALKLCDPQAYQDEPELIEADTQLVEFINSGQVSTFGKYLFAKQDNFALARQLIRDNPELGKIDRPRLVFDVIPVEGSKRFILRGTKK